MPEFSAEQLLQRGLEFHRAGDLAAAEPLYRAALSREPAHAEGLNFLGVLLYRSGRYAEAVEILRRSVESLESYPDAHNNLALALRELGKNEEAVKEFRRAIELWPEYAEAHSNLGQTLKGMGALPEAITACRRAVEVNPRYANGWDNLGTLLLEDRQTEEAIRAFRTAVGLQKGFGAALSNLCVALALTGALEEALRCGREGLALDPENPKAYINLAGTLQQAGNVREGLALLQRAVEKDPTSADAWWNLSMALLLEGRYEEGWPLYEWRLKCEENSRNARAFAQPTWTVESLQGGTLYVYPEQGVGDAIQFVRYVPLLAERGIKVILECERGLMRLFASVRGVSQLVESATEASGFDKQCSLMSLPAAFRTTLLSVPREVPYLAAPVERKDHFQQRLAGLANTTAPNGMRNVGIVWSGNPRHKNDLNRSMAPWLLEPLKKVRNVRFISLQKNMPGRTPGKNPLPMTDWTGELEDFAETAGLMANLDLVISVDTSVAHLAGAMGKPVWVMLPFAPEWRWMLESEASVWYPTMRLFRQRTRGDWGTVVNRIRRELESLAAGN